MHYRLTTLGDLALHRADDGARIGTSRGKPLALLERLRRLASPIPALASALARTMAPAPTPIGEACAARGTLRPLGVRALLARPLRRSAA